MTLDTRIWIQGNIHGSQIFDLGLRALLRAANRYEEYHSVEVVHHDGKRHTRASDGLPAIVECYYREDGAAYAPEDLFDPDEPEFIIQRKCQAMLSLDSQIGYHDTNCSTPAVLHSYALLELRSSLPAHVSLSWMDEFTSKIHQDVSLADIESFCGHGIETVSWFETVVKPDIEAQKEVS